MGKKKIIEQTEEETLKEKEKVETAISKVLKTEKDVPEKRIESGRVYINATYNNTVISFADREGNVVSWASAGSLGFTGPKKATPFAASKIVAALAEKVKKTGMANIEVIVKGIGKGRDSAIRSLANQGFNILSIKDVTPIPHNGPRPRKVRRV